ncbi:MAG TPA: ribosome-associated translation inhibitor RaiA [Vicinamibacterales bacterium]|nr:ribosome-associated translation inhibitor RaiA [Vicinamibacterales bacterium]
MRLELTGRHVDITPALRRLVDRRLAGLQRILNDGLVSAQVVLTQDKFRHRVEVTLHARGEKFLRAAAATESWDGSLSTVAEKLEHQAQTLKGKREARQRRPAPRSARVAREQIGEARPEREPGQARKPRIVRAPRYLTKPMTVEDAALEVDGQRDAVFVFRNAATDAINVLYRRSTGDLRLIEPER